MLSALVEHPARLAAAIVVLGLVNYGLGLVALRAESRQRLFERADASKPIASRSPAVQFALPLIPTALIAALVFALDPMSREMLGGGWLVVQLTTLILNVDGLLRARVLSVPGVADGRIVISRQFQYLNSAARSIAFALLAEIIALLFQSVAFAAGGAFLAATAVGWYRRARQVSERVGPG